MPFADEVALLKKFDADIHRYQAFFNILHTLSPTNIQSEQDHFVKEQGRYNPQFTYTFPNEETMQFMMKYLKEVGVTYQHTKKFKNPIAKLLRAKLDEHQDIYYLIQAYKDQNAKNIFLYNEKLFGQVIPEYLEEGKIILAEYPESKAVSQGKIFSRQEAIQYLRTYLDTHDLQGVEIQERTVAPYRISVVYTANSIRLRLGKFSALTQEDLDAIIAHEISTHIQRYIAGKKSGRRIFTLGTAGNIVEEEGLAVYQANQAHRLYNPDYVHLPMYIKYLTSNFAQTHDFIQTAEYLHGLSPKRPLVSLFNAVLRCKMGIQDTGNTLGSLQRDSIFLCGYHRIDSWLKGGGKITNLFAGKIRIQEIGVLD